MPTYVYECRQCEKTFEVEQRIVEDPLTDCNCGAKGSLKRLIQPTAVMFKGGGFHINDYSTSTAPKAECTGEPTSCGACTPPAAE
jgi:putative FmdB family regulatory protein